ncbi:unnamed protein product [Ectocarpus sp. 12 AP-2014]
MVRCKGQQPGPRCGASLRRYDFTGMTQMTLRHAHGRLSSHGHHSVCLQVRVRPQCALAMVWMEMLSFPPTRGWRCYLSLNCCFVSKWGATSTCTLSLEIANTGRCVCGT